MVLLKQRFYRPWAGFSGCQQPNSQEAEQDATDGEATDLPVIELHQLGEEPAPSARCDQGEQTLYDQHQRQGEPERFFSQGYFLGLATAEPPLRNTLKNSLDEGSSTITSLLFANEAL